MKTLSCCLAAVTVLVALPAPTDSAQAAAQVAPAPALAAPNPNAPLYRAKGEQYRVYEFPGTGESIPYRLFVPSRWTPDTKLPLLVTLRAGNSVNNNYRSNNDFVKQAEQRGYLVVTPMGYRPLSQPYYGSPYPVLRTTGPSTPAAGWTDQENQRAEQDVMNVIELVSREYQVDRSRIYLHGQNPSGSGALHLTAKYPDAFAAVLISSAPIDFSTYPAGNIKGKLAMMVIHGDQDTVNPVAASQKMAADAKAAGIDTVYATVAGGTHLEAYLTYAGPIFDFFDAHRKPQ